MNAPKHPPAMPAALALALSVFARFLATPDERAKHPLWTDEDGPLPLVGAWLTSTFFFALVADDTDAPPDAARTALAELVGALAAQRYTVRTGSVQQVGRVRDALRHHRGVHTIDPAEVGIYADCLPARERYARLGLDALSNRAVEADELRALTTGPWTAPVDVLRCGVRHPATGALGAGLSLAAPGWRALLRAVDTATLDRPPPPYQEGRPVVLVCAACGATGGYHATEQDGREAARRRRWSRVASDEGDVYLCQPCTARGVEVRA